MRIRFKKLHPDAKLPLRGSADAAGYDLFACTLEVVGNLCIYGTGLAVELPEEYYGMICPRSSGVFRGAQMHGPTIIDSDYRGEIKIMFTPRLRGNERERAELLAWLKENGKEQSLANYFFSEGERIAQLVVQPFVAIDPVWVDELSETQRGAGGYGSTGA